MKRSEMVKLLGEKLSDLPFCDQKAAGLLDFIEELGMLPPTQTPSLVEDTYNGGIKHGPAQRVWDKED